MIGEFPGKSLSPFLWPFSVSFTLGGIKNDRQKQNKNTELWKEIRHSNSHLTMILPRFPIWCRFVVTMYLLTLAACAPMERYKEREVELSPETIYALDRFKDAERLFEQQSYHNALAIYTDYLKQHPKGPLRDTAWLKTGVIYMALENYGQAQEAFRHLLSAHPDSSLAPEAGYQLALAYYEDKKYESAIEQGKWALEHAKSDCQRFRLYHLLAYTYTANREFSNAVMSYADAYKLAPPDVRSEILGEIQETITFLDTPELESLVEIFRRQIPGGYLHLQLAQRYASDGRIESSLEVLSDFLGLYPDHREREAALAFRRELESRAVVDRFLIGCILPLSGPYAVFGERALTGIELALDLFNAQAHTHPIQLAVRDSRGDPKEAVAALKALALNEGAIGVIGPMITSESVAVEAQALKIPIVTLTQKPGIPELGDYVFRNFLTPSCQVETIVNYAVNELELSRFAILYPEEPYGISFMNKFWDKLIDIGAELVGIESYAPEQTDFNKEIRKLVGLYYPRPEPTEEEWSSSELEVWNTLLNLHWAPLQARQIETTDRSAVNTVFAQEHAERDEDDGPEPIIDFEAIFIPDSYDKVGLIAPQLLYHGVENVLLLGSNLWHSPKLIEMAQEYVQGAIIAEGFFAQSPLPRVVNFVKNYNWLFKNTPGYLEAQAYDTAWILYEAVNIPNVKSRMALKSALTAVADFPGITGITSFTENGEINKDTYLLKIRGRRFIQIRP